MKDSTRCRTVAIPCETDTVQLGAELAAEIRSGLVFLYGDLGAGKTTLVRGWLRQMGYQGSVKSPTYTLIEPYELKGSSILHIDLYRIDDAEELEYIGLSEQVDQSDLQLVEWPDRGLGRLPDPDVIVRIHVGDKERVAQIYQFEDGP